MNPIREINRKTEKAYSYAFKNDYLYKDHNLTFIRKGIDEDLKKIFKDNPQSISHKKIFNVGSGREAIAFHARGAKKVYHIDICKRAVHNLKKYSQKHTSKSIISQRLDICSPNQNLTPEKIDIIYLNGILQHLYDPGQAFINLNNILNTQGILFIRTYKSGLFFFFILGFLRKLFQYISSKQMVTYCRKRHQGEDIYANIFVCEMFDDLFVPELNIYSHQDLVNYFKDSSYNPLYTQERDGNPVLNNNPYTLSNPIHGDESKCLIFQKYHHKSEIKAFPLKTDPLHFDIHNPRMKKIKEIFEDMEYSIKTNRRKGQIAQIIYDIYSLISFRNRKNVPENMCLELIKNYIQKIA